MSWIRPDKLKVDDGLLSLPQCARIAGVPETTLHNWIASGLIKPTEAAGVRPGPGNHRRFNLRDLTAICVVAELRERGVHVRALRKIQAELRAWSDGYDDAREIFIIHNLAHGSTTLSSLDLELIVKRARSEFFSALKENPTIRGRRAGCAR